jgi:hypothetical protein
MTTEVDLRAKGIIVCSATVMDRTTTRTRFVLITKYRGKVITEPMLKDLSNDSLEDIAS